MATTREKSVEGLAATGMNVMTETEVARLSETALFWLRRNLTIEKQELVKKINESQALHEVTLRINWITPRPASELIDSDIENIVTKVLLQKPDLEARAKADEEAKLTNQTQLFLKTLSERTLTIKCFPTDTWGHIKELVLQDSEHSTLRVEDLRIIVGGKQVENEKLYKDYPAICQEGTAHLVLRLAKSNPQREATQSKDDPLSLSGSKHSTPNEEKGGTRTFQQVLLYLSSDGKSFEVYLRVDDPTTGFFKKCSASDQIQPIFKEALVCKTYQNAWDILARIKSNENNCQATISNILHVNNTKYGHALFIGFGGAAHGCSYDEMLAFLQQVDKNECRKVHVTSQYSSKLDGQSTVYTQGLFNETVALLSGKRKIFANFRAWWNNDGILFADTRALLAGKRPFMANTWNYFFSPKADIEEKAECVSELHHHRRTV